MYLWKVSFHCRHFSDMSYHMHFRWTLRNDCGRGLNSSKLSRSSYATKPCVNRPSSLRRKSSRNRYAASKSRQMALKKAITDLFITVCLQIDLESYEWGLSARSVDLIWNPSIAGNDGRRVKQTMLYFQACCYFFRNKLYPNRSVRDALNIWLFWYHNFLKTICFLSKRIRACNFVQVRVLKKHWLLKLN